MLRILILWATFISAFLLFTIQPLYAKFLLPDFGGTPSVWTISVFFYSVTLLVGYIFANQLIQWPARSARYLYGMLLVLSGGILLSVWLGGGVPPLIDVIAHDAPAVSVLLTLLAALGMPILLLSTVSVLMQVLYAKLTNEEPYRLYAVSNIGSFLGLLSYPFLFEPFSGLSVQSIVWTGGFIILIVLLMAVWRQVEKVVQNPIQPLVKIANNRLHNGWKIIMLAAIPTFLLVTITEFISKGIASFPLLWIIPLALYLLSFIVAFDSRKSLVVFPPLGVLVLISTVPLLAIIPIINTSTIIFICGLIYLMIFFFLASTYFHRLIYNARPAVSGLGSFYIRVTLGGAIGSGIVGFILPVILWDTIELYLAITAFIILLILQSGTKQWLLRFFPNRLVLSLRGLGVFSALVFSLVSVFGTSYVAADRNFFGTLKVLDQTVEVYGEDVRTRSIVNGKTNHGLQALDGRYQQTAASYYGPDSGIDIALRSFIDAGHAPSVAVVGLGAGMMNAYCDDVSRLDYIEINPMVEDLAREYFTYLEMCPDKTSVVIGDGRLELEKMAQVQPGKYDIIMIDAFTDNAIPAHLLTAEAFSDAYAPNLTPDGIVAIHISNRYLNLESPVAGMAQVNGSAAVAVRSDGDPENELYQPTHWVLLTSEQQRENLLSYPNTSESKISSLVWTDERSSILQVVTVIGSH